jgi:hypothetical protein
MSIVTPQATIDAQLTIGWVNPTVEKYSSTFYVSSALYWPGCTATNRPVSINKTFHIQTLRSMVTHITTASFVSVSPRLHKILFTSIAFILYTYTTYMKFGVGGTQLPYWKMCPFGHDKFKISYFIQQLLLSFLTNKLNAKF